MPAKVHERRRAPWFSWLSVLLSAGVHLITFVALGSVRIEPPPPRPQELEFSVVSEPEPEPIAEVEPEPEAPPEPEPEPVKVVKPKLVMPPPPAEKAEAKPEPPPAAEETLADFSGTTLTSEGVGGWASAVGSGAAMNGPVGKPNAVVTGRDRKGVVGGVVGGAAGLRVVTEDHLSRRPKPPSSELLNAALERHYPKSAREQGIEGAARVKLRIMPNGSIQALATVSESYASFAEACKAAMRELSWTPALDETGQPVATDVPFNCEFTLY